jgi:hypothetical protein
MWPAISVAQSVLASRGKSSWAANEAVACLLSFLALEAQLIVA